MESSPVYTDAEIAAPGWSEKPKAEEVDVFYDGSRFLFDNGETYVPMNNDSLRKQLRIRGFHNDDITEYICKVQTDHFVTYAGPLAGRKRGPYKNNGTLLLATSNPTITPSKSGPCPNTLDFVRNLFGGEQIQIDHFMGWMKLARRSLLKGERSKGQALALAGPVSCGKTQLISRVIVPALGGRQAKPYSYVSGKTTFNGDLVGAETLVIDDEAGSHHLAERRKLADGLKTALFNDSVRIEAKHKGGFDFDPLWRMVIAVNDEPEALLVMPPITRDIDDKLMVLKCHPALDISNDDFDNWKALIKAELPSFLHLVESFDVPVEYREPRCMVKAYRHPDIMEAMNQLTPEHQIREIIDNAEEQGIIALPWEGSASQLRNILITSPTFTRDVERITPVPNVMGRYLARLSEHGVQEKAGIRSPAIWQIAKSA